MNEDLQLLRAIANGGSFDQTAAVRMLARFVTEQTVSKQAPAATMDAPGVAPEPELKARAKTKPSATT